MDTIGYVIFIHSLNKRIKCIMKNIFKKLQAHFNLNLAQQSKVRASTPLGEMAQEGEVEEVKKILARGDSINEKNANGETALMLAVIHGRPEVVRVLLDKGADPEIKNSAGYT